MSTVIELIVGLGNPGPEHQQTLHNAGFWLVDLIARECGETFKRDKRLQSELADVRVDGHRVRLLKPQTYMNASGRAVSAALSYYKIDPEHMLVAHDELDLAPGRVQLKFGGGHAGHNGVRDIIAHVGPAFWRLRLGVGHPGHGSEGRVTGHLLGRASSRETDPVLDGIMAAAEGIPVMLRHGAERAKTLLHSREHGTTDAGTDGD
jgi:PTH1 family peptidyl-tRNA hydrolase